MAAPPRAEYKKRRLWCQVTLIDDYIAIVRDMSFFSGLFGLYHPAYVELLTNLSREMASDPRFRNVRWYFDHQVLSGAPGAQEPVAAA